MLCQQPWSKTDVEPGMMVSATLGEIHFPRCSGRRMWPPRHPSALQPSGKQASLSENSLERSPAQRASHRGWGAGRKHWDSFPRAPMPGRTPRCRLMGWDPRGSYTPPQEAEVRKSGRLESASHHLTAEMGPGEKWLGAPCS